MRFFGRDFFWEPFVRDFFRDDAVRKRNSENSMVEGPPVFQESCQELVCGIAEDSGRRFLGLKAKRFRDVCDRVGWDFARF